jgi:myxalamid-type polyketide synthase MxaE and MxaD
VAGVFSLEDGLKLIAARGALMQALPAGGEMVVVRADETRVAAALESVANVAIAAINGADNTVISGAGQAVRRVAASLEASGIETRALQLSHAFHSPLMEPILQSFERIAREVTFNSPQLTLISNLTGSVVTDEVTSPAYWSRHIRQPVRFAEGMETLHEMDAEIFIEIGPKPTLLAIARSLSHSPTRHWLPTLRQGRGDWQQMLESLGQLYVRGLPVDWDGLHGEALHRRLQLPTYPWQRKRYWIEGAPRGMLGNKGVVTDYYNSLSLIEGEQEADFEERFLTFAPFPEPVPGFSWIMLFANPQKYPEDAKMVLDAQKEIREILFGQVDFGRVSSVLDFGCGYGSDLIALAQKYEHLELCGYTISDKQATIVRQKIESRHLQGRISVFARDSARDDFPEHYDLVFGFEVASHIKDKPALFSNISRHLNPGGWLVLADFISNSTFAIEHDETSSYIVTKEKWAQWLSQNKLQLVAGVDISPEVANFLYDPDFKENAARLTESNLDHNVTAAVESYNHLAQLLRRKLASYVLLTVQKEEKRSVSEIYALNQEKLNALTSYADVSLKKWLYELAWLPQAQAAAISMADKTPATPLEERGRPASWLIFADEGGMGERLAELLMQRGENCLIVSAGEKRGLADIEWLLQEGQASSSTPLRGVIYLWALEGTTSSELTANSLGETTVRGCGTLLHLVQGLSKLKDSEGQTEKPTPEVRLWVVTRGAVPFKNESLALASSPLWGLGKVIAMEQPALWGGMLDLSPDVPLNKDEAFDEAQAAALLVEIWAPSGEDQLAWRDGERYVARLVRPTYQTGQTWRVEPEGSYLITGGLGALGLQVARFLGAQGAEHLLLLGRSGASSSQAEQTIQQLEEAGVKVQVIQADVSDAHDMGRVFERIARTSPPLRGIVHAAGLFASQALDSLDLAAFKAVLRAKVEGTWLLHQLSEKMKLDFFVCFSSIASVWGSQGMAHYAAANHFMDAMAHYRRGLGLPALTVNWGPWAGGGMASADYHKVQPSVGPGRELAKVGIKSIPPEKAIKALQHLLATNAVQTTVAHVDWSLFKGLYEVRTQSQLFNQIALIPTQGQQSGTSAQQEDAAVSFSPEQLSANISKEVAAVLKLAPEEVEPEQALNTLGLDSLMMIELKNNLEVKWGISLAMADFAQDVTVAQLTALVQQQLATNLSRERARTTDVEMGWRGEVMPIVPSQHWFFEANYPHPHQWNLGTLFEVPPELDILWLQEALHYNLTHHEALGLRFRKQPTGWQQIINPPNAIVPFLQVDLSTLPDDMKSAAVEAKIRGLRRTIEFTKGPLLRLVHFDFGQEQVGRLLILVHHLALDAFGLRLFLHDLFTVYEQLAQGEEMRLPPIKTSYATWVRRLVDYAQSAACEQELPLWLDLLQGPITPLPLDFPDGDNNEDSAQEYTIWMTIEESQTLLQTLPAAFDVQITDILLSALLQAVSAWSSSETLYFETQRHGRDELLAGVDLSRTVCWANTIYPVLLRRHEQHGSPGESLRHVKKQLRRIPNSGLGFGLLRYLNQKPAIRQQLTALPEPEIKFIYHGHLTDSSTNQSSSFQIAKESTGINFGPQNHARARLYVYGYLIAKQLKVELVYSKNLFKRSTMEELGQQIAKQLRRLIETSD